MASKTSKSGVIAELREIPGVGISIANDLYDIGIRCISDLKMRDPDDLYDKSNAFAGMTQDRCLLYVFREAVYFAETPEKERDPDKLKWWNWKDPSKTKSRKIKPSADKFLGAVSSAWLREAGIHSLRDVEALGSVQAYARVKRLYPEKVSLNLLYGLEAARIGISWTKLSKETKFRLKKEAQEALIG